MEEEDEELHEIAKNINESNLRIIEEYKKGEKIIEIINNYIEDYNFYGAQALNNINIPVKLYYELIHGIKLYKLIMIRGKGQDGNVAIFGKNDKSPIKIYDKKVGESKYFTITSKYKALFVAFQKIMMLRALNDANYSNIDTKLENIMISDDGEVGMIDIESIAEHGVENLYYTKNTVAPEILTEKIAVPESDVFSDAIDRPYILFGSIADKYLSRDKCHADFFNKFEEANNWTVKNYKNNFSKNGFKEPIFPDYFSNPQKMRYMYYFLGFLKIQKEVGEIYPIEVLKSFSKLQTLCTEPNPKKRIYEKDVEEILLHLMLTIENWKDGIFRIKGMIIYPESPADQVLPINLEEN